MARLISGSLGGGGGTGDVVGPAGATDNALARFDATTGKLIQNSTATLDDLGELATASLSTNGHHALQVKPYGASAGQTGEVSFHELSGGNYVGFRAPDAITADVVWTLPAADGTANQVLSTSGAGVLSWASAGLVRFTEAESTTGPNTTVYVDSLTANGASTDVDAVLKPKGAGALIAAIPDSAIAGGNKRGARAVDLQLVRSGAAQVASGAAAFIGGGGNNTASGNYSAIAGGFGGTASAQYATIAGGYLCDATGQYSFVGGGQNNNATGNYAAAVGGGENTASGVAALIGAGFYHTLAGDYGFIGGGGTGVSGNGNSISSARLGGFIGAGTLNSIGTSGNYSAIGGGSSNTCGNAYGFIGSGQTNTASGLNGFIGSGASNVTQGHYSAIPGGQSNTCAGGWASAVGRNNQAQQDYSAITGGQYATAQFIYEIAHASGRFAANGDAQASEIVLRRSVTVGAAAVELTFEGGTPTSIQVPTLTTNTAYQFRASIVARDTGTTGQFAWWNVVGGIKKDGTVASTALIGANVIDTGNSGGNSAGWTATVGAESVTNGAIQILVAAPAGTGPVRFVATVQLTRVA